MQYVVARHDDDNLACSFLACLIFHKNLLRRNALVFSLLIAPLVLFLRGFSFARDNLGINNLGINNVSLKKSLIMKKQKKTKTQKFNKKKN
jgi:predicted membrane protein